MATTVEVPRYSATVPIGEIISTDPPQGTVVPEDAVITVYVSLGPAAATRWTGANSAIVDAAVSPSYTTGIPGVSPPTISDAAIISVFVKLDFSEGALYVCDANVTVPWDDQDWLGLGQFGGIQAVGESLELIAQPVRLTLSGVDPSLVTSAMESQYEGRDVTIYLAVFDAYTLALLDDPELLWEGFMDVMHIEIRQNSGAIQLDCEHWMRRQPKASRWTDEDQRLRFAGDVGFNRLSKIRGAIAHWGTRETGYGGGGGSSGGGRRGHRQPH